MSDVGGQGRDRGQGVEGIQEQRSCQEMLGKDGITSRSISSIRVGKLGCSKLIPGAGIRLWLRSGRMCL